MYCLDKLQRELAYYFSKDIRELPKVESLLAEAGYTQIRKGDDIIEIDSALGLESQAGKEASAEAPAQKGLFDTQESHTQKVDSTEPSFTYTTGEAKSIGQLRKDLKAALEPYKSTPIINKETGLQGVVTTDEINKIASKKAVDKSIVNGFSRDEHFAAAQDLKNLFENATKAQSHNDYKQRENIAQVHRFIQDLHINDKPAQAKITLFEKIEGKNRIYTLELESLNKPDPLSASVPNTESAAKAQSVATARTETTTIAKTDGEIIAEVINRREVRDVIDNLQSIEIPKEADVKYFYELVENSLDFIKNKENLITDLQAATDSRSKAFWDFVMKPTLKDWDFKLHFGDGDTRITKIFKHTDLYAVSVDNIKGKNRVEIHKYNRLSDGFDIAKKIETTKPLPQAERLKKEKQYNQSRGITEAKQLRETLKTNLGSKDGWNNFEYKIVADDEAVKNFLSNRYPKPSIDEARAEIQTKRKEIEALVGIKPIAEFGENYAEHYHSGQSAIQKLLLERNGQVSGAFYRKELGDIDVVWGQITDLEKHDGYGLTHIIDKRKAEFMQQGLSEAEAEAKALEFAKNEITDIIENGKITSKPNEATKIETQDYKLILKQNWNGEPLENKWIVTAYIKKEKGESISSTPFTKGDNLPLNSNESITQQIIKQALKTTTRETEKFMQLAQDLQNKSLSKNDKIQIIDNLVSALFSLENKMPEFIEEIMEKANKATMPYASSVDRAKYKGFNASDKYAMFEAFRVIKLLDAYDDAEKLIEGIKKGKDIDFNNKILTKMQNTEKALTLTQTQASLGVRNDFEKVLKNHERDVNLLIDKALKLLGDKKIQSSPHAGAGLLGGSVAGIETDENGNITFNPEKFALGLLGGAGASIGISKTINKRASGKYTIMSRMEAKKHNKKLYNVFKAIDSSAKYGSKMNLIGKENLNADTLAYALARNKRFAINKLDEKTAKEMGFKYPHDVRRSIDPNNVAHTLNRHGEQSNLVQFSGQKPVTLDEIAKYQDYADNATHKGISIGKRQETANISARQLDGEFYVVVEQIQKGQNELGFKTMYFERGILDDEKFNKLLKK